MIYNCKIESIGAYYPEKLVSTSAIFDNLSIGGESKFKKVTGIENRHFCSELEDTLELALNASQICLGHSKYNAEDIEMIISCSISKYVNGLKHYFEPAISSMLRKYLGNKKTINFDVSNACAGMLTGVYIANSFIKQGIIKNCLIVSGEYISSITKNAIKNINSILHPEVASLTVGDAGAAVILERSTSRKDSIDFIEMQTLSQFAHLCKGYQCEKSPGACMKTDMKTIHQVSLEYSPEIVSKALKVAGIRYQDIDYIIPHQTAKSSIEQGKNCFNKYFKHENKNVLVNLEETGNTASTTHFTTLYKNLKKDIFKASDRIMLISYASGLVIGSLVFRTNNLIKQYGSNN
jgi:3-oxoacyl-[acyl-carrier-protein] synthase-3